jgi:hypothetical protein
MLAAALASIGVSIMVPVDRKYFTLILFAVTMRSIFRQVALATGLWKPIEEGRGNEKRIITVESAVAYFSIVFCVYKFVYNPKQIPTGLFNTFMGASGLSPEEMNFADGMRAINELKSR